VGLVDVHYKEAVPATGASHGAPGIVLVHGFNGSVFNW
jgi:pimeloyl-ACP methyl ester carboxylesterase